MAFKAPLPNLIAKLSPKSPAALFVFCISSRICCPPTSTPSTKLSNASLASDTTTNPPIASEVSSIALNPSLRRLPAASLTLSKKFSTSFTPVVSDINLPNPTPTRLIASTINANALTTPSAIASICSPKLVFIPCAILFAVIPMLLIISILVAIPLPNAIIPLSAFCPIDLANANTSFSLSLKAFVKFCKNTVASGLNALPIADWKSNSASPAWFTAPLYVFANFCADPSISPPNSRNFAMVSSILSVTPASNPAAAKTPFSLNTSAAPLPALKALCNCPAATSKGIPKLPAISAANLMLSSNSPIVPLTVDNAGALAANSSNDTGNSFATSLILLSAAAPPSALPTMLLNVTPTSSICDATFNDLLN